MQKRRKLIVAIATVCLAVFAVLGMAMAASWIGNTPLNKELTIGDTISINLSEGGTETEYYDENNQKITAKTLLPGYHVDVTVNYTITVHDNEKYQIKLTDNGSTADWQHWKLFVVTAGEGSTEQETEVTLNTGGRTVIDGLTASGSVKLRFYFDKGGSPANAKAETSEANKAMKVSLTLEEMTA